MPNPFASFDTSSPLDQPVETITPYRPTGIAVPNRQPALTNFPYRIAIIGDVPNKDDELQGKPFCGMAGRLLDGLLAKAGIIREACMLGNVCQHPLTDTQLESIESNQLYHEGLEKLKADLDIFKPNICLLLGRAPLYAAMGKATIGNYRGTLFIGQGIFDGIKCVATYHPQSCLRQYDWTAFMWFDIVKCLKESQHSTLSLPIRNLYVNPTVDEVIARLDDINQRQCLTSVDIEGYINSVSCCSFATSESESFIVPFANLDKGSYWQNEDDEIRVWKAFTSVLTNPRVPKVFQNGLYDRFVLAYSYGITVRGNVDDTMLKWAEKWCELEKGLGVQASVLTNEPYYKFERKSDTREAFYSYCCKDSAVTYEINSRLTGLLDEGQRQHYHFNMAALNPMLYMEMRGIRYATAEAKKRQAEIDSLLYSLQARLDTLAGVGVTKTIDRQTLLTKIRETCCYKRDPNTPKKDFVDVYDQLVSLVNKPSPLTDIDIGFINMSCGWSMNIKSPAWKTFLYSTLGLPKQYDTKTKVLTTDYEALLKISKKSPHEAVALALEIGELRTRSQMLSIKADTDGRIRCGYNIVGTETGRITCYTSPTGSGYNLQTIPDSNALKPEGHPLRNGLRSLFTADEGYYLFQCDLSGADGWTVGAHLASLGDPTMLDDLRYGLKPASVICYMLRHGNNSLTGKDRAEVKQLIKEVKKEDWDYFACKCGIWGTCYTMGPRKLSDLVLTLSEGKVIFEESKARTFQQAIFQRYNVHLWHRSMERKLKQKPELLSPNGHRRRFFGRPTDILGQALAHEPQVNTTYATNSAMYKLWTDPANRCQQVDKRKIQLRIEPLHQVHDAIVGQFKIEDTEWAIGKLKSYFNNEIIIAGIPIVIPFGGAYGKSWGELDNEMPK